MNTFSDFIVPIVMSFIILFFGFMLGYSDGKVAGYAKALDDQVKKECELKFNKMPLEKISGECLKYFPAIK